MSGWAKWGNGAAFADDGLGKLRGSHRNVGDDTRDLDPEVGAVVPRQELDDLGDDPVLSDLVSDGPVLLRVFDEETTEPP